MHPRLLFTSRIKKYHNSVPFVAFMFYANTFWTVKKHRYGSSNERRQIEVSYIKYPFRVSVWQLNVLFFLGNNLWSMHLNVSYTARRPFPYMQVSIMVCKKLMNDFPVDSVNTMFIYRWSPAEALGFEALRKNCGGDGQRQSLRNVHTEVFLSSQIQKFHQKQCGCLQCDESITRRWLNDAKKCQPNK